MGMKIRALLLLILLAAVALAQAAPARAQVISLDSVSATKVGDTLAAEFGVSLTGAEEIAETLRNGVPLQLVCRASLDQNRRYFFDQLLGDGRFEATLHYDALAKEYVLTLPGKSQPDRDAELGPLLERGWKQFSIPLCPWGSLMRGKNYALEVEAVLMPMDVPDWFTRTFLFWSWRGGPTVTSTLEFRY